ncbi:MAG: hypothetical protein CMF74_02465 [Maricaulis sp.]|jgi:hypothetical protein|nr:hypothetical protein [Maricaulis sp.]HAQ35186.1 hypothetical protein [Alphaproteobacteria bacterium]
MSELIDFGASAVTGGALGVIGTAIGRAAGFFERRQEFTQERERWAHERQLAETETAAAERAADRAAESELRQASYGGLQASLDAERSVRDSYPWVEAVRALVRPILTPLLWLLYLVVFFAVMEGQAERYLTPEAQGDFVGYFIANIAFAATAATLWWFGDRAPPPNWRR